MWFATYFREHDFDLDNPELVDFELHGVPIITYKKYHCKNCDKTLSMYLNQSKKLPRNVTHGCTNNKRKDNG